MSPNTHVSLDGVAKSMPTKPSPILNNDGLIYVIDDTGYRDMHER